MSDAMERATDLYEELHRLAQTEGNEPIRCSRMHFSEWADDVNTLGQEIERLLAIIDAHLHLRKCHDCGHEFYAKNSVVPYCICKCGSQDTRRVKTARTSAGCEYGS